jgi:hypothetical protein
LLSGQLDRPGADGGGVHCWGWPRGQIDGHGQAGVEEQRAQRVAQASVGERGRVDAADEIAQLGQRRGR